MFNKPFLNEVPIWELPEQSGSSGKSTQLSYLSKSKYTLIENVLSKSESHPVE